MKPTKFITTFIICLTFSICVFAQQETESVLLSIENFKKSVCEEESPIDFQKVEKWAHLENDKFQCKLKINMNCCGKKKVNAELDKNNIVVLIISDEGTCSCKCIFALDFEVTGLNKNIKYNIEIDKDITAPLEEMVRGFKMNYDMRKNELSKEEKEQFKQDFLQFYEQVVSSMQPNQRNLKRIEYLFKKYKLE
jgi:hypothetical protein